MASIEKTIPQLDPVASASNTALIAVSDGGAANGMTRLEYCRISAEGGQATYIYDQSGNIRAELGAVQGDLFYGPETAPGIQALVAIQAGGITLVDEAGNTAVDISDPTGVVLPALTASRAVVTGAQKQLASSATTATELGYVNGVTSSIQNQLNAKSATGAVTSTGITMTSARVLGRTTALSGAVEEITVGTGLSLSAGTLTSTDVGAGVSALGSVSGAQIADFAYAGTTITATGATSLTTSNRVAGKHHTLMITASGADRTITPSASWVWVGSDYSAGLTIPSGKVAIITLTVFAAAETDVVAAGAIQP